VQETEAELLDLVTTLLRVGKPLSLPIVEDCIAIQTSILAPVVVAPVAAEPIKVPSQPDVQAVEDVVQPVQDVSEILPADIVSVEVVEIGTAVTKVVAEPEAISVSEIIQIAGDETSQIGDEVKERLLSHSYVLHLNGDIRDRASDELLVDVNPGSAQSLGAFLISRKPSGGRIRITEDGTLCAFFEEKWGYLAKVKPEDWFPDHLHIGTN
jgi:hypothetical protein